MPSIIYLIHDYLGHHLINQSENKKKILRGLYEVGAGWPSNHKGCDILPATKNHDSVHIADS